MKVATLLNGAFVQVSGDLQTCRAFGVRDFQTALDTGTFAAEGSSLPFPSAVAAPLPRAYQFLDGSAYVNHVELVRRARGAEMPERFWTDPLMYQGCSAPILGPTAPITGEAAWGIDFEAEIAVITTYVPMGISSDIAADHVAFVMLLNDISLRGLIPDELSKGFGFVHSKPPSHCSPVAVSPDALPGWDGRKLHGTLNVNLNGYPFGRADAGVDMTFDFGDLIAHAAKTRALPAGSIIGSGTISNKQGGGPGLPIAQGGVGYSCIAEQRTVETILHGAPTTPFLSQGDRVEIWMTEETGQDIFGRISQQVETT